MNRDELIESQLKTAYALAHEAKRRMPAHVELDELVGDALHGLVVAADCFEEERGLAFSSYARWRIRGFIIDGLRSRDVVSRRRDWDPDDPRLAPAVALDAPMSEGDGVSLQSSIADPHDAMAEHDNGALIDWLLARLPDRERNVVMTIVWGDISESDLAERRGLTPSRISQIYTEGLHRMRLDMIEAGLGSKHMFDLVRKRMRSGRGRKLSPAEYRLIFAAVGG